MTMRHFNASSLSPFVSVVCIMVSMSFLAPLLHPTAATTRAERGYILLHVLGACLSCILVYISQKIISHRHYTFSELQQLTPSAQARYLMKVCARQFTSTRVALVTSGYIDIVGVQESKKTMLRFVMAHDMYTQLSPESLKRSAQASGASHILVILPEALPLSLRATLRKHAITLLSKKTLVSWLNDYSQAALV